MRAKASELLVGSDLRQRHVACILKQRYCRKGETNLAKIPMVTTLQEHVLPPDAVHHEPDEEVFLVGRSFIKKVQSLDEVSPANAGRTSPQSPQRKRVRSDSVAGGADILEMLLETLATRKSLSSTPGSREQVAEEIPQRRKDIKECSVPMACGDFRTNNSGNAPKKYTDRNLYYYQRLIMTLNKRLR